MGIINAQINVITAKSRFQPGSYVWFGQPNQIADPDNPATLKIPYLDPDLTQPASAIQGLDSDSKFQQTITGLLYGSGLYSIRVMTAADNTGKQLYYIPEVTVTPTVNELGTAAYSDIATEAEALAGTAGVLPDAAGVHSAIRGLAVGTVSQSGGVPTGAIIELGSNANGEYVKFADGTMICTHRIDRGAIAYTAFNNIAIGDAFTWIYPVGFAASPRISIQGANAANNWLWGSAGVPSVSGVALNTLSSSIGYSVQTSVDLIAIGKWY